MIVTPNPQQAGPQSSKDKPKMAESPAPGTIVICETERLQLIAASEVHAQFISDMWNREGVKEWLLEYGLNTPQDVCEKFVPIGEPYAKRMGFSMCVIKEKSTGNLVGINGMLKRDFLDSPNIGYAVHPDFWNCGYATESCQGLVDLCRSKGYKKLYAGNVNPLNDRSISVLKRIGMKMENPAFQWGEGGTIGHLFSMVV